MRVTPTLMFFDMQYSSMPFSGRLSSKLNCTCASAKGSKRHVMAVL